MYANSLQSCLRVVPGVAAAMLLLAAPIRGAEAQDDYKVIKLEQDVRNLERQLRELTRQVGELQRQPSSELLRPGAKRPQPANAGTQWLDIEHWNRLRTGMTELQVIELLGAPTSMRAGDNSRTLFYAMEIGTSGFLSGSVQLVDRKVAQINQPVLH